MSSAKSNAYPSEHVEQRNFVRWFRLQYPGVRIFAIPNGEARSKSVAGRLKAEGVSAGVPDLCIPAWSTWVEMKRAKGGRLSDKQKDWSTYLEGIGYAFIVGHGFEDAKEKIEKRYLQVNRQPI